MTSNRDTAAARPPEYESFVSKLACNWWKPLFLLRWLWTGDADSKHFRGPVRWLLGRDLLHNFRSIALYAAHGEELDHRDWMQAKPIDLTSLASNGEPFWFDVMSDIGDGQLAMYNHAYLALGGLSLDGPAKKGTRVRADASADAALPRGRFLFLGGDTAYHVADLATIDERVRRPFAWALLARDKLRTSSNAAHDRHEHFVFAIPGNHDYYDSLSGYNRMLRAPGDPNLRLADFVRRQSASYVGLRLPYDWRFVGLDAQGGKLDHRQREFMRRMVKGAKRLIVATPEPAVVFEGVAAEAARPFADIGLARPFLREAATLPDDTIHLDLAGDVHHYARYQVDGTNNYAYVVAGGGAFLHPSHPSHRTNGRFPPAPAERFPGAEDSARSITRRLLCPWYVFRGGLVWLVGAVCALAVYFCVVAAPNTRFLSEHVQTLVARHAPGIERPSVKLESDVVKAVAERIVQAHLPSADASESAGSFSAIEVPEVVAVIALFVVLGAGVCATRHFKRAAGVPETRENVPASAYLPFGIFAALGTGVLAGARLVQGQRHGEVAHSFLSSLLLATFVVALPLAWAWTTRYVATLPKQAKIRTITWRDALPRWLALAFGVEAAIYGLLSYGELPVAVHAADIVFVLAVLVAGIGPGLLGAIQGAAGLRPAKKGLMLLLGLWLGALALVVPLLLGLHAGGAALALAAVLPIVVGLPTAFLMQRWGVSRWVLLGLWVLLGVAVVAVVSLDPVPPRTTTQGFLISFLAGAYFTCVWFGWYLAVALAFDAHFNEAGGAARLDRYRHFIRFKLEPDCLTGYVIGWRCPSVELEQLDARLVDVITLTPESNVNARTCNVKIARSAESPEALP